MSEPAYEGYALVEQMGFRKTVGRIREVEQFGTKMLRLDVPIPGAKEMDAPIEWVTRYCGGPSLYQVTPLAEDVALEMIRQQGDPRPVRPTGFQIEHRSDADNGGDIDEDEERPF
jgi:hypothetical protein